MSLISSSHLSLVRARKELEKAFDENRWDELKDLDKSLGASLNQAFDDKQRDPTSLVHELEKVLSLYASMVEAMPGATIDVAGLRSE